ncbi:hypothetical protein PPTG_24309 [Phytophthora nicotianae INRA-310]|uniref:Uncharacterized protein n=1 Tax=Phytophthora nicotianae (strain INRA-310) TaxID=761204 RepID=W2PIM2_PHYN3|nr:hypothetical protein PPTG_24309 [Phytophthora nicotianae INRA-310]ETN00094.1 hypothetical protein PPTG_24309 [Phytophthora nicotianae INRA-310]
MSNATHRAKCSAGGQIRPLQRISVLAGDRALVQAMRGLVANYANSKNVYALSIDNYISK